MVNEDHSGIIYCVARATTDRFADREKMLRALLRSFAFVDDPKELQLAATRAVRAAKLAKQAEQPEKAAQSGQKKPAKPAK